MKRPQYGGQQKPCHDLINDLTLFKHYQILCIMYTHKDSNLVSHLKHILEAHTRKCPPSNKSIKPLDNNRSYVHFVSAIDLNTLLNTTGRIHYIIIF